MKKFNINDLALENAGQWPDLAKYAVAFILAIFVIVASYLIFTGPNFNQLTQLQTEEASLKENFENKQRQAVNLTAYQNQLQILNERFGNMIKQLPAQTEMVGLLDDISKTGVSSGLTFELFAPMPEVIHDYYIELPINIKVVGNYMELAVFISRIAAMQRIVTLHDFQIAPLQDDKNKDKTLSGDVLEMSITVKIYRYRN